MLYQCSSPAGDGASKPAPAAVRRPRGKGETLRVDIHCHVVSTAASKMAGTPPTPSLEPMSFFSSDDSREVNHGQAQLNLPKLTSTAHRLADMDAMGIDVQVLSPSPAQYFYWAEAEAGVALSRMVNDHVAATIAEAPERFAGLGTLPMQHPAAACDELERCVRELGLKGVELGTNVNGDELSDERFHPILRKAEELGVLLFLHPMGFSQGQRLSTHYLNNVVGNPLDTTIALSHLIFDGTLDRFPNLKICAAHGGGFLGSYSGRMDHAWCARPDCRRHARHSPSEYLKKMYFDTVVFDAPSLDFLVRQYGYEHILLGTDYPFDMGDSDPLTLIDQLQAVDGEARQAMQGGNAIRLLGLQHVFGAMR